MAWRTWRAAWQDALYGPSGFYRQQPGPAGHFATSANGIPGGRAVLAGAVVGLARRSGCPRVVEVGAGRGELMTAVQAAAPDLQLAAVDVVDRPAGLSPAIDWAVADGGAHVPDCVRDLRRTLVLAHELLDVVPCTVAEYDGTHWRTVEVDPAGVERLGAPLESADLSWLQRHWPSPTYAGERSEVGSTRDRTFRQLATRITSGLLVAVDYGHLRDRRPRAGTLTGFREGRQCAPVPDGSTDVTAHVAMDTLGADRVLTQREVLAEFGGRTDRPPIALATSDPPAYLEALAARGARATLTAPGGLGDFLWAVQPIGED